MKTKTINLYSFDELNEDQKQKAIDNLRDINVNYQWWEFVYEDAENIGLKITSFDLDRNRHATGNFMYSFIDCCDLIIENHGKDCETYKLAKTYSNQWDELVEKHSDGITIDRVAEENEFEFDKEADELENDFLKDLLEEYSLMLEREYEYLTSDEQIIEAIKANEYKFNDKCEIDY